MKKHACLFSLVELLVVISIIAVLTSILLPALNTARQRADSMVCISNLKQIGAGTFAYVSDSDGYYPPSVYNNNSYTNVPGTWHTRLDTYVTKKLKPNNVDWTTGFSASQIIPVWQCPTDAKRPVPWNYAGNISYFGNAYLFREWTYVGGVAAPRGVNSNGKGGTRVSQIRNHGKTLMVGHYSHGYYQAWRSLALTSYKHWNNSWRRYAMMTQIAYPNFSDNSGQTLPNWHLNLHAGKASYLAADGHAELLDSDAISDVNNPSYGGYGQGVMYFVPPSYTDINW